MSRLILCACCILLALSASARAVGVEGDLLVSAIAMNHVNRLIAQFDESTSSGLGELNLAWGGEIWASFPELLGVVPHLGVRGLIAATQEDRAFVHSSLIGLCAGGLVSLGSWDLLAHVGAYRAVFSFPSARYKDLTGWGIGLTGKVGYAVRLTSRLSLSIRLTADWLPVTKMADGLGRTYKGRGDPFLDFSGVGASIGLGWVTH